MMACVFVERPSMTPTGGKTEKNELILPHSYSHHRRGAMNRELLLLGVLLTACTDHNPGSQETDEETDEGSAQGFVHRVRADFELITMSAEEKQAFEDRATLRERRREQGLRVCEEGEHGTEWKEDCKVCRCEHGLRNCPAIHCTHARDGGNTRTEPLPYNRRPLTLP